MNFISYPDDVLKEGQDEDVSLPKPKKFELISDDSRNYYEFLRFSEETERQLEDGKNSSINRDYHFYTNFNDVKIVSVDISNFDKKIKIIDEAKFLSDNQNKIEDNKEFWLNNLEEAILFNRLTAREIADYKLVVFKDRVMTSFYSGISSKTVITAGLFTYNFAVQPEIIKVLTNVTAADLTTNFVSSTPSSKIDFLFEKEKEDAKQLKALKEEHKLYNYNGVLALYYCILYESLKDKPNIKKIKSLNEMRKDLLATKKADEFTKDVDNYIRVRI